MLNYFWKGKWTQNENSKKFTFESSFDKILEFGTYWRQKFLRVLSNIIQLIKKRFIQIEK